ncbi:E3 ubiquitin-protein ligase, partial [Ophiophagus hannah]
LGVTPSLWPLALTFPSPADTGLECPVCKEDYTVAEQSLLRQMGEGALSLALGQEISGATTANSNSPSIVLYGPL